MNCGAELALWEHDRRPQERKSRVAAHDRRLPEGKSRLAERDPRSRGQARSRRRVMRGWRSCRAARRGQLTSNQPTPTPAHPAPPARAAPPNRRRRALDRQHALVERAAQQQPRRSRHLEALRTTHPLHVAIDRLQPATPQRVHLEGLAVEGAPRDTSRDLGFVHGNRARASKEALESVCPRAEVPARLSLEIAGTRQHLVAEALDGERAPLERAEEEQRTSEHGHGAHARHDAHTSVHSASG